MSAVAEPPAAPEISALSPAAAAVWRSLSALPDADRAAILTLAASPAAEPPAPAWPPADSPLGRRQRAELDRRLAAMDAGEVTCEPASDVLRRMRETILRWDRERAAGLPYTPYEVAGRSVSPADFEGERATGADG